MILTREEFKIKSDYFRSQDRTKKRDEIIRLVNVALNTSYKEGEQLPVDIATGSDSTLGPEIAALYAAGGWKVGYSDGGDRGKEHLLFYAHQDK